MPSVQCRKGWSRPRSGTERRLAASVLPLIAILTALAAEPLAAQSDGCLSNECFNSGRIRDFQIIDRDTLVVYVGRDRCAFVVDVDSLFCDLTFLPDVEFFRTRDRMLEQRTGRRESRQSGFGRNQRVCPNTATQFSLETFGFTSAEQDETPAGRPPCEVRGVTPASDNDLLELLTLEGITPPPPPVGNGEISRSQRDAGGSEQSQ